MFLKVILGAPKPNFGRKQPPSSRVGGRSKRYYILLLNVIVHAVAEIIVCNNF